MIDMRVATLYLIIIFEIYTIGRDRCIISNIRLEYDYIIKCVYKLYVLRYVD